MRSTTLLVGLLLVPGLACLARAADEKVDTWNGYTRRTFTVDGCQAWVVEPKQALPGKPWSWCMEFPDAFTEQCAAPALLAKGFHHVHIVVGNTFGCPAAMRHFNAFYDVLQSRGLAKKAVLIGISRGGLYAYRWASENPDKVAVIYGDAPVCDFKSWPGGKGQGSGSPGDWKKLLQDYGFQDEAEALAYRGNPIDVLDAAGEGQESLSSMWWATPTRWCRWPRTPRSSRRATRSWAAKSRSSISPASGTTRTASTIRPPW